jgi:hypothetical protein
MKYRTAMTRYKKIFFFVTAATLFLTGGFFLLVPDSALALTTQIVPSQCANSSACGLCELGLAFKNATDIMIALAGPAAVVFLFWAALMFMMSGGSQSRVSEAKKIATAAVVGLLIVLFSWIILNTLINFVFQASTPGSVYSGIAPWNTIDCQALIYPSISTIPPVGTPIVPPGSATTTCPYAFGYGTDSAGVRKQFYHVILGVVTQARDSGVQQNISATLAAFNSLKVAAQTKYPGVYDGMSPSSVYRPYLYQAHLYDLYTLDTNQTLAADQNCSILKSQVRNMLANHGIAGVVGAPNACGISSKHVVGASIDISDASRGQSFTSTQYNDLNNLAQANNIPLVWRAYPGDPAHFDLSNPPYKGCNNVNEWY